MIKDLRGFTPKIGKDVFIADSAEIIGDVTIGDRCSIWFKAILRGDVNTITIGNEVNIQDLCLLHCTYQKTTLTIEDRVSVGHGVMLHGCKIGKSSLIGMGCIIMDNAVIPANSLVGAGSLVTEGATFPEGHLILGRPARAVRPLTPEELKRIDKSADNYKFYTTWYKNT
ncbi:MAG: gamma carbonic anhydrase family protein [Bdellovibrionales bacterium]|nr:gamma carbonic anhydrase family protein [Bdellovibrionales bacterium]